MKIGIKRQIIKFITFSAIGLLVINITSAIAQPTPENDEFNELAEQVEELAVELSVLFSENGTLALVSEQFQASPKTDTLILRDVLATIARQQEETETEQVFRLAATVQHIETRMSELGAPVPRLDLTLPVATHRELLSTSDEVFVVAAIFIDDDDLESITAYLQGEQTTLNLDEMPEVPTFVISPADTENLDPDYPLTVVQEPRDEENPEQVVDDFVGLPYILITNDHEPFTCGSPEIYVHFRRWLSFSVWQDKKVELKNVNNEDQWYWLGDPNNTYVYLDNRYASEMEIIVYEDDNFWCGGSDDVVGVFIVNWRNLPFGGYTNRTNRDAQIYLDRD